MPSDRPKDRNEWAGVLRRRAQALLVASSEVEGLSYPLAIAQWPDSATPLSSRRPTAEARVESRRAVAAVKAEPRVSIRDLPAPELMADGCADEKAHANAGHNWNLDRREQVPAKASNPAPLAKAAAKDEYKRKNIRGPGARRANRLNW